MNVIMVVQLNHYNGSHGASANCQSIEVFFLVFGGIHGVISLLSFPSSAFFAGRQIPLPTGCREACTAMGHHPTHIVQRIWI